MCRLVPRLGGAVALAMTAWAGPLFAGATSASASAPATPSPVVLSARAAPAELPAAGGTVTVAARVDHAATCQLRLLSRQDFAVVYSHDPKTCAGGAYSARATIGPNPTAVPRTVAFALVARDGASAFTARFYVLLARGAPGQTTTSPPAPATTTAPGAGPSVPIGTVQSSNWSGYSAAGGPYTVVKGTFTVPTPVAGTPSRDQVAEWVGVDGTSASDPSLIQAGVDEHTDPANPAGLIVEPWWEILPATATPITSVPVNAGDQVTVTIWQISGTSWEISLVDDTTGKGFTTPPEQYTGPGSTAEWVVEATTLCRAQCRTAPLAPYSPPVTFSDLGTTGPVTSLEEIAMIQGPGDVSTPSTIGPNGFKVTYTGMQFFGDRR